MRRPVIESKNKLIDEQYRVYFQTKVLLMILGSVSLFMCILNIFTQKQLLMWFTGGFAVLAFTNFIIINKHKKLYIANTLALVLSIYVLFVYFIITGGTSGFSPHWILLLPAVSCFMWGRKQGIIYTTIFLLILTFLLWIPLGQNMLVYEYSKEFRMRFPLVYIAFGAVGIMFEAVRLMTYKELEKAQDDIRVQAETDSLTGIHNRWWFNNQIDELYARKVTHQDGLMLLFDIDHFKNFNDTYGHVVGDKVLVAVAGAVAGSLRDSDYFCRWGGEEFFAFLPDCPCASAEDLCNRIRKAVESCSVEDENGNVVHVTISIGAVCIRNGMVINPDTCFILADEAMYKAKSEGRNRSVVTYLEKN